MVRGRPLWDRTDYLSLQAAIAFAALIVTAVSVGLPLWDWARGNPVYGIIETPAISHELPASLAAARPGASLTWDGVIQAEVADPSAALRLVNLIPGLLLSIAVIVVAAILYRLVVAARAGRPFVPAAVRDLRIVAVVIFAASVLIPVASAYAGSRLHTAAIADDALFSVSASFGLNLAWIGLAMLVFVLAEVFRIGQRLADDVDGLV
ncbi:MAG: DUF2975 domain-containing protein [Nocardioidaceae bacterium]